MKISLGHYWFLLVKYLKPQWPKALLLTVLLFSSIGLQLLNPQILRHFIDRATAGETGEALAWIALIFIGAGLSQQLISAFATYVGEDVGWTATNWLRADLARHSLDLDMSFHNSHTPGEMIERLDGDVTALATFFSQFVLQVLGSLFLLVGVLVLLFKEDWRAGLALTVFAVGAVYIINRSKDIAVPHIIKERESSAQLFGFIEERLSGLSDLRANGAAAYTLNRFYQVNQNFFRLGLKSGTWRTVLWITMVALFTVGYVLAFSVGAALFGAGVLTLGTVYLLFQYTEMLRNPLEQMTRQLQELQKASAGIARIQQLLATEAKIKDHPGQQLPGGPLSVEFDQVTFSYQDDRRETVLHDLSFKLEPGKVLGLLGRTGSGKSTLTRLLFRLYDPTEGRVRVGGVDTREAQLSGGQGLRQRVGMVTQEVQLFHATVRENLTFFDPTIPDERILHIIEELGLQDWLNALPDGLDTMLQAGGAGLSAGEAQLLAFTRVFLRDPGLVILDEPSSRLDPATENLIEQAVSKLLRNRTGIIIAHRLATVQRADQIMIIQNGHICEHGPREGLLQDKESRFYNLLQTGLEKELV
jgi:ABC-type multidrug transport system fused ATPase/permease subunit